MFILSCHCQCTGVLDQAVGLLNEHHPGQVPPFILEASMRYTAAVNMGAGSGDSLS